MSKCQPPWVAPLFNLDRDMRTRVLTNPSNKTWASYQIRKIAGCTCAGDVGNVFPAIDFKGNRLLAIPAYITARASSSMSGSLTGGGKENVRGIPSACAPRNFTYLEEARAAHTIILWPQPKRWIMIHISELTMIINEVMMKWYTICGHFTNMI